MYASAGGPSGACAYRSSYWRASVRKLSRQWFLAVHLPVLLVIALRIFSGLGWKPLSFPVLVGAFFLGQYVGGKLPRLFTRRPLPR